MKDSKNQETQGWKRRRETDKRGYNTKGHGERGNRKNITPKVRKYGIGETWDSNRRVIEEIMRES
jgi:hypothetical protein